MGIEFLRDGELNVMRYDAPELLAIKHGEWSLERIKAEAEHLFRRAAVRRAYRIKTSRSRSSRGGLRPVLAPADPQLGADETAARQGQPALRRAIRRAGPV
jgi:hypothetical protein